MWHASPEQLRELAKLHTETVKEAGAACTGFVCDNAKLRDFISSKVDKSTASEYKKEVADVRAENVASDDGMVMKRQEMNPAETVTNHINGIIVAAVVAVVLVALIILIRRRKKNIA